MTAGLQTTDASDLIAGRYRVEALLGEGGAARVYRVHDERTGRALALKQLHAAGEGAAAPGAQFEREYHTLRQLAHPRIIEVYDYGVDAPGAYYTMELLDGLDLQSLGKQPWPKACALLCDVASSLAIVHSRRLVHRDVSAGRPRSHARSQVRAPAARCRFRRRERGRGGVVRRGAFMPVAAGARPER
jgi:eukaryotic-like serine/threonine-protein kinase